MSDDEKSIYARLGALPTAVLGDTLREAGFHHQALHHSIAGLDRGMRCSGPAFCMAGEATFDVIETFADTRQFGDDRDFQIPEQVAAAKAGQLENLRRADCAGR